MALGALVPAAIALAALAAKLAGCSGEDRPLELPPWQAPDGGAEGEGEGEEIDGGNYPDVAESDSGIFDVGGGDSGNLEVDGGEALPTGTCYVSVDIPNSGGARLGVQLDPGQASGQWRVSWQQMQVRAGDWPLAGQSVAEPELMGTYSMSDPANSSVRLQSLSTTEDREGVVFPMTHIAGEAPEAPDRAGANVFILYKPEALQAENLCLSGGNCVAGEFLKVLIPDPIASGFVTGGVLLENFEIVCHREDESQ
jgi:predicted small lipoprotein YifL